MAEIIDKEDLIGSVETEKVETGISDIDRILNLLDKIQALISNPLIQQLMAKFFRRGYDYYPYPQTYPAETNDMSNAENVYNQVLGAIEVLISTMGDDVKLSDVRQYMIDHKDEVVKQIKTFLGL